MRAVDGLYDALSGQRERVAAARHLREVLSGARNHIRFAVRFIGATRFIKQVFAHDEREVIVHGRLQLRFHLGATFQRFGEAIVFDQTRQFALQRAFPLAQLRELGFALTERAFVLIAPIQPRFIRAGFQL